MEPQFNEGPRGWQNLFAITRFRYIEILFHIFYCYWGQENRSLYQGLRRYIEVRYIEVSLYVRIQATGEKHKKKCTVNCIFKVDITCFISSAEHDDAPVSPASQ